MIFAYCFIGPLPEYAVDTVYQARLFYKGPIYFILSDMESSYVKKLEEMQVTIVNYASVVDKGFNECLEKYNRFEVIHRLQGRERLFQYSFERFFVLYQLMNQYNLSNVFFLELDNLIYDDPLKWEEQFCSKDMAYMHDNRGRGASGVCFIKNTSILFDCTEFFKEYIMNPPDHLSEMPALYKFWEKNQDRIQILPIHWPSDNLPNELSMNYTNYNNTVFDAAAFGIYLGGMDPYHTGGVVVRNVHNNDLSAIKAASYQFEWRRDELNRNIPYILYGTTWIRINNLHIHSKDLKACLSISY